uniref:Cathepsin L1-like n=1 Tax=Diabrotica virgifera virgifera TaxID=50390 RepID=A0A6P7HAA3_DIAVI
MMKLLIFLVCIVAVNCLNDTKHWNDFKVKFEKSYGDQNEESQRFEIFQGKLREIEEHNARFNNGEETYTKGINQFSDMTHEEYIEMLSYSKELRPARSQHVTLRTFPREALADLPDFVDWREKNVVTEVKNQEACGSCWAFSTTGGLEGQYALKYNKLVSLSEQNLLDCSGPYGNGNCSVGGIMRFGLDYVKDNGINTEETYPYEAVQKECRYQPSQNVLRISGYDVFEQSEEALQYAVATYGPISVAIDFSLAGGYASGIFNNPACHNKPEELNHGVLVVGYGRENSIDYWIVKNSWSANFGEKGYIRMIRNANNQCGIVDDTSKAIVI